MLTAKECTAQLERLTDLRRFPETDAGRKDLLKALRSADDVAMLVSVVDAWVHDEEFAPRPANLYRLITEERERRNVAAIPRYTKEPVDAEWEVQFRADCDRLTEKIRMRRRDA